MALKATVDTIDEVPEAARELYTEREGKFFLAVDGLVAKDKLDEFRTNNIQLRREMDEVKAKFDGIDPDEYRKLSDRAKRDADKKLIDAGKVEELFEQRTSAMVADHNKLLKAHEAREAALTAQLGGLVIDGAIRDAATKTGVRASAIEDVLLRGRQVFKLVDGKAVPMDGDNQIFGKTGGPMDISEWVSGLMERAPHLFEPSQGGGAPKGQAVPSNPGAGRISRDDQRGFLDNLASIASGKVSVVG